MTCYSEDGKIVPDGNLAYAKESDGKYYIKEVKVGQEKGLLYNPWSMWFNENLNKGKVDYRGSNALEYRKVPETVFSFYKKFLETRNISYYNTAERIRMTHGS